MSSFLRLDIKPSSTPRGSCNSVDATKFFEDGKRFMATSLVSYALELMPIRSFLQWETAAKSFQNCLAIETDFSSSSFEIGCLPDQYETVRGDA
jgi:hypothetical protein